MEAVYQKVDVYSTKTDHARFKENKSDEMKFIKKFFKNLINSKNNIQI